MDKLLFEPVYWNWWLLGLILIIAEMLVPGTFILWLGIAAFGAGVLALLFPSLSWQWQWLSFALLTLISMLLWWFYFRHHPLYSDDPHLNRRGLRYLDQLFTLESPIINGHGKLRVGDSFWKISGPDCAAGTLVRVVGADGVVLKVQREQSPPLDGQASNKAGKPPRSP